jgi:Phasin protein
MDSPQTPSPFGTLFPDLGTIGKKHLEEFTKFQRELFQRLPEVSREWADRVQSEATFASEFATKLSSTRSIPEATTVCQEWAGRRMEMATEDAKRILADSQKLLETGTRLISNGWLSNGRGGMT